MKNFFFGFLAIAFLMLASCSQSSNSSNGNAENAPIMKFEKSIHDFGRLRIGDSVSYDFKFTNTGKSPLIITSGTATCGCTTPTWPKKPLQPGEGGQIHVTFKTVGKQPGLQDKMITITANTNPTSNYMHLIGELIP